MAEKVPEMYNYCIVLWAILGVLGACGVSRNPEYVAEQKEKMNQSKPNQINETEDFLAEPEPIGFLEGLKTWRFLHIGLMIYTGLFYGVYLAGVYKTTAQDFISDKALTTAGALGSLCNGGSRILWATLYDHYGFKKVYFTLLCIQLVVSSTIFYLKMQPTLYTIWVGLSFLCEGGHFSLFPTLTCRIFGMTNGG